MKKLFWILALTLIGIKGFAQIEFEAGYIIDNDGKKIDCLIKNMDWKGNPKDFLYQLSEGSEPKRGNLENIQEFGINDEVLYRRFQVGIDRSSEELDEITEDKNPKLVVETLFLKTLIDGVASLYYYGDGKSKKYFFTSEDASIQQLIFKNYLNSERNILENNAFRSQIWDHVWCPVFTMKDLESLDYKEAELVSHFSRYNRCKNETFAEYTRPKRKGLFSLHIRPGVSFSSLSIDNFSTNSRDADFGNATNFRIGLEAVMVLPFHRNKIALLFEPSYQKYQGKQEVNFQKTMVDYTSINLPIGVRYYSFLSDQSKVFIDGSFSFELGMGSQIEYEFQNPLDLKTRPNLLLGVGYIFQDKFSFALQYNLNRKVLSNYRLWDSNHRRIVAMVGYRLFKG